MLKYFRGYQAPMKIYLHKNLIHEYFHARNNPTYGIAQFAVNCMVPQKI